MGKIRGFKLGRRFCRIARWIIRKTRKRPEYERLAPLDPSSKSKTISKLLDWGRWLKSGAKSLCSAKPRSGYITLGQDPIKQKPVAIPKGHLAVYVGQKDGDFHRVLVPVIYFNHPLFGQLLREAEEEFGFNQQGGITIPCRFSDFEKVKTRIDSGSRPGKLVRKRHY